MYRDYYLYLALGALTAGFGIIMAAYAIVNDLTVHPIAWGTILALVVCGMGVMNLTILIERKGL